MGRNKKRHNILIARPFNCAVLSCSMKMELNLMRSIYGKESAAPRGIGVKLRIPKTSRVAAAAAIAAG
jgi:hypothetical protein